jgi:hypothetical protein
MIPGLRIILTYKPISYNYTFCYLFYASVSTVIVSYPDRCGSVTGTFQTPAGEAGTWVSCSTMQRMMKYKTSEKTEWDISDNVAD